ncbi:MAG TPA: hypothetical protein VKR52_05845 [Terracidiphilus sp.]|nr:hypothetical protein [Terracidiphilus sp.]
MKSLAIVGTSWQISQALLGLQDRKKAAEYLRAARDADPMGKYQKLADDQLTQLGA